MPAYHASHELRPSRHHSWTNVEPNAIDVARDAFDLLTTGPKPLRLDGRVIDGLPDRWLHLPRVRDLLLDRSCPQVTRDAVWAQVVARSRTEGGAWTVGAVGMALPALTTIAARLTDRFAGDPADVHSEVLAGFLAALSVVAVDRPRIMLRLRWAAYRAGHAALSEALDAPPPCKSSSGSLPPAPPWGHPDLVLARAVADGAISRQEADLIGATRLENVAVADWSTAHGASTWAVYKQRRRAESQLAAYLLDIDEEDVASELSSSTPTRRVDAHRSDPPPRSPRRSA